MYTQKSKLQQIADSFDYKLETRNNRVYGLMPIVTQFGNSYQYITVDDLPILCMNSHNRFVQDVGHYENIKSRTNRTST